MSGAWACGCAFILAVWSLLSGGAFYQLTTRYGLSTQKSIIAILVVSVIIFVGLPYMFPGLVKKNQDD